MRNILLYRTLTPAFSQTHATCIYTNKGFLDVLRNDVTVQQFPKASTFSIPAGFTRTMVFFAHTLLHELCHSVWKSSAALTPDRNTAPPHTSEPFYRDQRIAELGWAFQQAVFHGAVRPNGYNPLTPARPLWPRRHAVVRGRFVPCVRRP